MSNTAEKVALGFAALIVAGGLAGIGWAATSPEYQQRMERETAEAQAYCQQVYGDPAVYTANAVGGHGGLHCEANTDVENKQSRTGPHLHEIPERYEERALRATRNGTNLGWTVEDAHRHGDPRPWWAMFEQLGIAAAAAVVIGVGVAGAAYFQN